MWLKVDYGRSGGTGTKNDENTSKKIFYDSSREA